MVEPDPLVYPVFEPLINELTKKTEQLEENVRAGKAPSRKDLEIYIWKTGRVCRMLVKPQENKSRDIFWSECKGVLKDCIVLEKFNPGVFTPECVRTDIIETNLLSMVKKLLRLTTQRKSGERSAPKEVQTLEVALKRKLEAEEIAEVKKTKEDEEWLAKEDEKWSWKKATDTVKRWDEDDSDLDEECPDVKKHGSCSYGRQCGFCDRNKVDET